MVRACKAYAGSSALIVATIMSGPAYAQAEADHAEEAETKIVVQATRTGRRVQDEPIRVEVIDREGVAALIGDVSLLRHFHARAQLLRMVRNH